MLCPSYTRRFEKDLALMRRRGKDAEKIKHVMLALVQELPLLAPHRDHTLSGAFASRRECHIEPDWLLIYKVAPGEIIFERTGTHADLFE